MTELKVKKAGDSKETFREKVTEIVDEMWDKIGRHHHGLYATPGKMGGPDADLSESDDALTYRLELPGMDEKDVDVEIDGDKLTVRGEKKDEKEEKGDNYHFKECRYGSFERRFILPQNVKAKEVKADFDKGVLTISVPRAALPKSEPEKVEIKVS